MGRSAISDRASSKCRCARWRRLLLEVPANELHSRSRYSGLGDFGDRVEWADRRSQIAHHRSADVHDGGGSCLRCPQMNCTHEAGTRALATSAIESNGQIGNLRSRIIEVQMCTMAEALA